MLVWSGLKLILIVGVPCRLHSIPVSRFRHVQTAISPGRERRRNRNGVDCTRRFDALSSNEPSYQVRRRVCFPGEQNCSRCVIYGASNYCWGTILASYWNIGLEFNINCLSSNIRLFLHTSCPFTPVAVCNFWGFSNCTCSTLSFCHYVILYIGWVAKRASYGQAW